MSDPLPCELPGMNEIMLCLDAALGPLAAMIDLANDPKLALDPTSDWAIENLDDALALAVPGAAFPVALLEVVKVAIDLPALGPPFSVGFSVHGWGTPQIDALTGLVLDVIMIPINLMISLINMEITPTASLCDIVRAGLPPIPGSGIDPYAAQDICVECIVAKLGPIFGMGC